MALLATFLAGDQAALIAGSRWMRALGTAGMDVAACGQPTSDGGFIVVGYTYDGPSPDGFCTKLDAAGNVQWERRLGGSDVDALYSCVETDDGGYLLVGDTSSSGAGWSDGWCVKLDSTGSVIWNRTYGGVSTEYFSSVVRASGGGFVVVGSTATFGVGMDDGWCLKLDGDGNPLWQKTYGSSITGDYLTSIDTAGDGGYYLAGIKGFVGNIGWCLKVGSDGTPLWERIVTPAGGIFNLDVLRRTSDGGFVLVGDVFVGSGNLDGWCVKFNSTGDLLWQKTYGGADHDVFRGVEQTSDGGCIAVGYSRSSGAGGDDAWCVKLDSTGNAAWARTYGGSGAEGFNGAGATSAGGTMVWGYTKSFGAGDDDVLAVSLGGVTGGDIDPSCGMAVQPSGPTAAATVDSFTPESSTVTSTSVTGASWSGSLTAIPFTNTLICESPALPDLSATWTKLNTTGTRVRGRVTCSNTGSADAGAFTIEVYLSKKAAIGGKSTKIGTYTIPSLAGGASTVIKIKGTKTSTQKYAVVSVDAGDSIAEEDEGNNIVTRML